MVKAGTNGQSVDPSAEAPDSKARNLGRAFQILSLLNEDQPALTLREMGEATGLPKTTVLRHVRNLEDEGLLWMDGQGRYLIGPRLAMWATLAANSWPPPQLVGLLNELVERAQETVKLSVRRDLRRVCIAYKEAARPLRDVVRIGEELPLWGGASSKILLLDAPEELLLAVASEVPSGSPNLHDLRKYVEEARESGFALSLGELEQGQSSVAVPVRDSKGRLVAALAFSGPTGRFENERTIPLVNLLKSASNRISDLWQLGRPSK